MKELRYTLVAEGSSDAALLPILDWLLIQNGVSCPIQSAFADLRTLPIPIRRNLSNKIRIGLKYFPCDLLFVHRDADRESREIRVQEIDKTVANLQEGLTTPYVCVIPVRMQEAWLLIDEAAVKSAAGNRHDAGSLDLPSVTDLERIPDPKERLHRLLGQASDLNRRRQRSFSVRRHARLVTEFIEDFTPLRQLSAFDALEEEVGGAIQANDWRL